MMDISLEMEGSHLGARLLKICLRGSRTSPSVTNPSPKWLLQGYHGGCTIREAYRKACYDFGMWGMGRSG